MIFKRFCFTLFLALSILAASLLYAQDNIPKYEFSANIDLSSIKETILQMNIDNLGYLYLRTYAKLYLLDTNTVPEGAILTTVDLKSPPKTVFLVNTSGKMCFANIEEIPVQIFDEKGELKAALGEMKTKKETYRNVEQIFVDSRNYYIVAARKKILTFDSQGNFDLVIDFERRFKIIHIDSKDNIYVLQQSIMSPEMKIELAKIEDSLSRLKEEVKWVEEDIQEIRENRDELSDDIDDLIKDKKDKFENLRELQKNPQINKTWIEKLKEDIEDIKEKIEDMQDDRKDLYDDYKDKLSEKKKLSLEEHDTAREKVELRRKANEVSRKDEYEVLIYDTGGEMVFAFLLPKPDSGTPMFSTYNIQSDEDSNFFSIPQDQGHDIATIINVTNERKAILGGAGYQVNVYSSDGSFLGPIKAEPQPPFDGISYIVLDNKRNLFVMDLSFSRIRKFKLVGALKK